MAYEVVFTEKALKDFRKLDTQVQRDINKWLDSHLNDCDDPRAYGKKLVGQYSTYWRYRIGKYRMIAFVEDEKLVIEVVKIGKRETIYKM